MATKVSERKFIKHTVFETILMHTGRLIGLEWNGSSLNEYNFIHFPSPPEQFPCLQDNFPLIPVSRCSDLATCRTTHRIIFLMLNVSAIYVHLLSFIMITTRCPNCRRLALRNMGGGQYGNRKWRLYMDLEIYGFNATRLWIRNHIPHKTFWSCYLSMP